MTQISTGILEPGELAFLHRCLAGICNRRGVPGGSDAANDLASQLFNLYRSGIREERDLASVLERVSVN